MPFGAAQAEPGQLLEHKFACLERSSCCNRGLLVLVQATHRVYFLLYLLDCFGLLFRLHGTVCFRSTFLLEQLVEPGSQYTRMFQ